ncbi:MAG: glutathione-disulfide reductase [Xanthomonadales bacterium]|jgi:glutathione reductase (NADPH)|nr:glutathione-disulfide reductase [Xanthomonadales bacterium]
MSTQRWDLITIGAGSGGVAASRYAAAKGARVLICEADRVGGTCVIRGCVPKKLFMYASQYADGQLDAAGYGWTLAPGHFNLERLTAAKQAETARLEGIYQRMLADSKVQLRQGRARVIDAHQVEVNGERLSADRVLIATGSTPNRRGVAGIELACTSDEMLDLTHLPERLLVLGSGFIAVEFAGIFRGFGSAVTLAYRADLPLRGFDQDLRQRLAGAMQERGIVLEPGFQPVRIERVGDEYHCHAADGRLQVADLVLNALGRSPNSANLGLEEAGVELQPETGAIRVDAHSRTRVPSIFAVGDVTNRVNLTPVAIAEARAFVDSEFGGTPRAVDHRLIASAVFSQPPLAQIGWTEEDARRRGHPLKIYEADFRPMKNVLAGRNERCYMKLLVHAGDDRVLGVHMLGSDAPEIVQALAVAITMGARKQDFDATMAVHPTAAEEFVLMRTPTR